MYLCSLLFTQHLEKWRYFPRHLNCVNRQSIKTLTLILSSGAFPMSAFEAFLPRPWPQDLASSSTVKTNMISLLSRYSGPLDVAVRR